MSLIDAFQTDELIITRFSSGTIIRGRYQKGDETTFTIQAVVLPVNGRERLLLPETIRTTEMVRIYTTENLFTTNEAHSKLADIILWRGNKYQIQKVESWTKTDLPHYVSLAVKIEKDVNERKIS
ncbi:MAG: hypothetical protein HRT90_07565 [Candidatus Margulisbacteria bacterium]|nr:hypothetical protein [Candidatus Margulisiibacteriota bacterium]